VDVLDAENTRKILKGKKNKMKIICIFAQRKERYEGEYAPELLTAIDEWGNEDNPDYLNEEQNKADDSKEFSIIKRMEIEVDQESFEEQLYGKTLKGIIK
jgi:hypothetical protein